MLGALSSFEANLPLGYLKALRSPDSFPFPTAVWVRG